MSEGLGWLAATREGGREGRRQARGITDHGNVRIPHCVCRIRLLHGGVAKRTYLDVIGAVGELAPVRRVEAEAGVGCVRRRRDGVRRSCKKRLSVAVSNHPPVSTLQDATSNTHTSI